MIMEVFRELSPPTASSSSSPPLSYCCYRYSHHLHFNVASMPMLSWNAAAASVATNYAATCNFQHNAARGPYGAYRRLFPFLRNVTSRVVCVPLDAFCYVDPPSQERISTFLVAQTPPVKPPLP